MDSSQIYSRPSTHYVQYTEATYVLSLLWRDSHARNRRLPSLWRPGRPRGEPAESAGSAKRFGGKRASRPERRATP